MGAGPLGAGLAHGRGLCLVGPSMDATPLPPPMLLKGQIVVVWRLRKQEHHHGNQTKLSMASSKPSIYPALTGLARHVLAAL